MSHPLRAGQGTNGQSGFATTNTNAGEMPAIPARKADQCRPNQPSDGGQGGVPSVVRIEDGQGSDGQGEVLLDMKQMSAQQKQEEITAKAHFTLAGEVEGECDGDLRIDVVGTDNLGGPKEGGSSKVQSPPLTATPGLFTVKVPKAS